MLELGEAYAACLQILQDVLRHAPCRLHVLPYGLVQL